MNDKINDGLLRRILGEDSDVCPVCNVQGNECRDTRDSWGLTGYPLAMVYAPDQLFENIYDTDKALCSGTIFKELDLPFMGMTVTKGGCCRG